MISILRFALFNWFVLTVAMGADGDSVPTPLASATPTSPMAGSGDDTKGAAEQRQNLAKQRMTPVILNKNKTERPFVLDKGMNNLPPLPVEQVLLFDSLQAFHQFVAQEQVSVLRIGVFKRVVVPEDEAKFREVLRAHAAQCGADYVAVITDKREILQNFHSLPDDSLAYVSLAFKRVRARLGIVPDSDAARKRLQIKVAGFIPGSHAKDSGLRVGDVIKKVDDSIVDSIEYWNRACRWKAGDKVKVEVEREGQNLEVEVELTAG